MRSKKNRKHNQKWWGLLMLLLVLVCSSMTTQAASQRTKAMKAYSRFLEKGYYSGRQRFYSLDSFTIADIDKNGIPELITTDNGIRIINVFTYKNGKVRCVEEWAGIVWENDRKGNYVRYSKSKKALIVAEHGGTGMWGYRLLSMKKNKLTETFKISISTSYDRWSNATRNCGYVKNGTWYNCSYKTYKKYESKYFTNSKVKKAYFVGNTKTNRKKKLR